MRNVKRIAIGIVGGAVTLVGIALLVLPGPAFIVIPVGLAILASEFEWAQRLLHRAEDRFRSWRARRRSSVSSSGR